MCRLSFVCAGLVVSIAAAGCSSFASSAPALTPTRAVVTPILPTAAATLAPPAGTLEPTDTPTLVAVPPTSEAAPSMTPTVPAGTMRIKLYLVAINDNGASGKKIGCNDSLVAVDRAIPATTAPLTAALKLLLSLTDKNYGESGLYNALYQSKLQVDSVAVDNGKAMIKLSGTLTLGGECDSPRVQAQIEQLALQFSTVKSVATYVNGVPLEQALSGKGG